MTRDTKSFVSLFSLALFTRIVFFLLVMPWKSSVEADYIIQPDGIEYHQLAQTLVRSHEFAYHEGGSPNALRTPGYPFYLSFFYFLFGSRPWIPIFFQLIIDSLSCLLLYTITLKFSTLRIAFITALFYALDPFLIFFSVTLLSEVLFVFLILVAALYFSKAIEQGFNSSSRWSMCLSGLFFGVATLVRPASLYLALIIPGFLFVMLRSNPKQYFIHSALFLTLFLLAISPWMVRNLFVFNTASMSTSGSFNLLILYVSPMESEKRELPVRGGVTKALLLEADSAMVHSGFDPSKLDDFQKSKYWRELAVHYITNNPLSFLKHYAIGIVHSFTNLNTAGFAKALRCPIEQGAFDIKGRSKPWAVVAEFFNRKTSCEKAIGILICLMLFFQYLCTCIGAITSWRIMDKKFLLFILSLAVYFILIAGPFGEARFRLPALPFYLVFAGVGLDYLISKLSPKITQ